MFAQLQQLSVSSLSSKFGPYRYVFDHFVLLFCRLFDSIIKMSKRNDEIELRPSSDVLGVIFGSKRVVTKFRFSSEPHQS